MESQDDFALASPSPTTALFEFQFGQNVGLAIFVALVQQKKFLSFPKGHDHLNDNRGNQAQQGGVERSRKTSGDIRQGVLEGCYVARILNSDTELTYGGSQT